ncbi:MAG: aminomethyl-transferring glycine dehydrogenase subunit GcvPA [Chloroflexi bacterium]|nr:aminomethyl-transferring glycine dehydrogenase subunit GcvPA [Chloroflexota bacterium]
MSYSPHTEQDRQRMLATVGAASVEELFNVVPEPIRFPTLQLPAALSELEAAQELSALASENLDASRYPIFLGAGAYNHYVPALVNQLVLRGEFYTAYTPYQPEISQGTLQSIYEYQSMVAELMGMEVCNASMYDGGSALAEAAVMAINSTRRGKVVVSPTVHPNYRAVLRTYVAGQSIEIVEPSLAAGRLTTDLDAVRAALGPDTAAVIVQYPNFLGAIEDLTALAEAAHAAGALLVVAAYPIALGLLKPPGAFDADIVVGEGQSLGNALSFGGPYVGMFTCKQQFIRSMPGRLVGATVDVQGRRGYVLTLQTREQHIRRERATSNICTNQGLNALIACLYLATMGKQGLRDVAELCYHKAHYAAGQIAALPGYRVLDGAPFFNEFVVQCPRPAAEVNAALLAAGIIGGYALSQEYPGLGHALLLTVTELNSRAEIDRLVAALPAM